MDIQKFIIIISTIFVLTASFYFVRGNLKSAKDIANESGSYWGANFALRKSLISAKIFSMIGFCFLIVAVVLQVCSLYLSNKHLISNYMKIGAFVMIALLITIFEWYLRYETVSLTKKSSVWVLEGFRRNDSQTIKEILLQSFESNYRELGKNYFYLGKPDKETDDEYLNRLCDEISAIKKWSCYGSA